MQMPPHIQVPGGRESKYSTLAPDSLQLTGKHVTWLFRMHGKGTYTDPEGVVWTGTFHNGKFDNGKAHISLR